MIIIAFLEKKLSFDPDERASTQNVYQLKNNIVKFTEFNFLPIDVKITNCLDGHDNSGNYIGNYYKRCLLCNPVSDLSVKDHEAILLLTK